jgi:hypothetical protein
MAPEPLWTAVELGVFSGLSPRTITNLASTKPERLPPRVKLRSRLRWVSSVCAVTRSLRRTAPWPSRTRAVGQVGRENTAAN